MLQWEQLHSITCSKSASTTNVFWPQWQPPVYRMALSSVAGDSKARRLKNHVERRLIERQHLPRGTVRVRDHGDRRAARLPVAERHVGEEPVLAVGAAAGGEALVEIRRFDHRERN